MEVPVLYVAIIVGCLELCSYFYRRRAANKRVESSFQTHHERSTYVTHQRKAEEGENREIVDFNPEKGWDDNTDTHGVVLDYVTREEVRRRVAFTAKMVSPKLAANNEYAFQKIFGDGDFMAAGILLIPVGGKKPSKGTKDNTYVWYVIKGAVSVTIHHTSFTVATGGMFLVPRGNDYCIENICRRSAKLFFSQAREVTVEDDTPQVRVAQRTSHAPVLSGNLSDPQGDVCYG